MQPLSAFCRGAVAACAMIVALNATAAENPNVLPASPPPAKGSNAPPAMLDAYLKAAAFAALVPMFVYVVTGLLERDNYMLFLGLGVTAATIVGFFAVPQYFYLWMAAFGGGALLMTGLVIRRKWASQ